MKEIRVLLIGHTGHGKSSVGNTLLGIEATGDNATCANATGVNATDVKGFAIGNESNSCTYKCDYKETIRDNVRLVVIDTPGMFDTLVSTKELQKELLKALLFSTPGFHVIAFVLQPVKFTDEIQETQKLFFRWFGGNVSSYACVILTHCSSEADVARYIKDPNPSLRALIDECGGIVCPFDNTAASDIKENQVRDFLQHVNHIQSKNGGQCFSNLIFNIAKEYAQKRDLQTITTDSLVLLKHAGINFKHDSVQSLKMVEGNEAPTTVQKFEENKSSKTGNLKIFYLGSTGAYSELQTRAENTGEFSETSSATSLNPYYATQATSLKQPSASPATSIKQPYASPATSLNQPSASPATSFNQHFASSATSGNSRFYQPSDGSMGRDNSSNMSDMFPAFRKDMHNEKNVNKFKRGLNWILGQMEDMGRRIRNFFTSDNYEKI